MLKHSLTWLTLDKSKVFGILWVYIDIVRIKCSWLYTPVDLGLYTICLGLYTVPGFIYIEQGVYGVGLDIAWSGHEINILLMFSGKERRYEFDTL